MSELVSASILATDLPEAVPAFNAESLGSVKPTHIVGVGASAGGLEALERLFDAMPDDTGMAFVVVQHLSLDFKSVMNEALARRTTMPIHTVQDQMPVAANTVFLTPPGTDMIISGGKLLLTARASSDELHLPIDQFLRSLARDVGPRAIAVILSGTGSDGSGGIRDVHEAGGLVFVQSVGTAMFDDMPKIAVETKVVDEVLAPEEIPDALLRRTNQLCSEHTQQGEHAGMAPIFRALQARNEELLASNRELQSTNEVLRSVNEELSTANGEHQKKIEELTQLTHDMDNLLLSTDVHTVFLDEQWCIRRFTPKTGKFFNLVGSDIGRSIHGFMHSIRCVGLTEKLEGVLSHRRQYEEEVQNTAGESFFMRILPYRGDPEQTGVVITLVEITKLKEAETRFKSALEVSPSGMLMVSSQGTITQVNTELERIFGYAPGELLGQALEVLIASEFSQRHQTLRQDYFRNPFVLRRMGNAPYVWGQHKNGHRIPLDVHVRPISTAKGRQAIASIVDVSQHQQLEQSLREQVKQRDRFLATLSHELRNPMGAMLSAASILEDVASQSDEVMRPCQVIQRQAAHMSLLLDDLLDVARLTQGKILLRMETVDLEGIGRKSIEAVQPILASRGHQLITHFPEVALRVRADPVRLLQILDNLLTNAIKYTDDGGRIELNLSGDDGQAVIRVRDNGRGMSQSFITSIFDMFVQSDDTLDRSEGGMGVGLTLVRSLVEMHSGTIQATSDGLGRGSEFVVRLPLTEESVPLVEPNASDCQTRKSCSKRIVLVEDNEDAREMMALLLKQYEHDVVATANDGDDGLDLICQHRPDVAIVDIGLPKLDGYQLARKVRSEFGDSIYLIALTGYGQADDHKKIIEAGYDQHLVKPVQIKRLCELLDRNAV